MQGEQQSFGLPKPGRALIGVMAVLSAIWVFFAVGMNWAGAGADVFGFLVGNDQILRGQLWRLLTAPLLHQPSGPGSVGHLLFALFGLYFLGATLEQRWGARRFVYFLLGAGVFASALQVLVTAVVTPLHQPLFFGSLGMIDAVAIAWALSFRGQQVRLMFVLPVSGTGLMIFVVAVNVLYIIAMEGRRDGLSRRSAGCCSASCSRRARRCGAGTCSASSGACRCGRPQAAGSRSAPRT